MGKVRGDWGPEEYKNSHFLDLLMLKNSETLPRGGSQVPESVCLREHCLEVALVLLLT
ncbi:hypothetical protein I79_022907 [Cricetulus griseus]|uniref:Uncharacterized protein n=1 Tax=Cricetulus griseus TaxID=10029 RepID=G3IGJ0_CRIGR|nr:hypothetical protein I79_022907 [Cricetulus griseus]